MKADESHLCCQKPSPSLEACRCRVRLQGRQEDGTARPPDSACSRQATSRGRHQRVVSYSLYLEGNGTEGDRRKYQDPLGYLPRLVADHYPGWVVRVYTDLDPGDKEDWAFMCGVQCRFPHVDFCSVEGLPRLGDVTGRQPVGRLWRYLPMVDPLVDVFVSRDIDSYVLKREEEAVTEWLASPYVFHCMRDHPNHGGPILAGLWGAKTYLNRSMISEIGNKILFQENPKSYKYFDQDVLTKHLWPVARHLMMAHDSFTCKQKEFFAASVRPFPTRRVGNRYVGYGATKDSAAAVIATSHCPVACRPVEHREWVKC
ncbi:unnamed protein product [Darwinula stevensoni]|uniref:Uncharacterized protein n=1 Tax=Darwinula stevensoni TaxID=69355 RepID=A0A7R8X5R1_9CRUS|nr:unnamed protein product [Darwinula stevensoni]CAG0886191.1 unnamed protein product [Darwinula stevensoni]